MVISYACVFVAGLMPVFCAGIAKAGAKGYDNHNPVLGWHSKVALERGPMPLRRTAWRPFHFCRWLGVGAADGCRSFRG